MEIEVKVDGKEYSYRNDDPKDIVSFKAIKPPSSKWKISIRDNDRALFSDYVVTNDLISVPKIGHMKSYLVSATYVTGSGAPLYLEINYR